MHDIHLVQSTDQSLSWRLTLWICVPELLLEYETESGHRDWNASTAHKGL